MLEESQVKNEFEDIGEACSLIWMRKAVKSVEASAMRPVEAFIAFQVSMG